MLLPAAAGCQQALPSADLKPAGERAAPLPPPLARMQQVYPDLHTGRFVVLADFNTSEQAELFRVVGPDGAPTPQQPAVTVRHAVEETGAGGLEVHLDSSQECLLFDGARSRTLALVRDWRRYSLLLLNICGPPEGVRLEFSIQSGSDLPLRWTRTIFAEPGWHPHRFDLDEVGDAVDLSDVRCLAWRAPAHAAPLTLYLDDLIIADNTRYVLGAEAAEGELYVFTQGRRIHVGVRGRFDLDFADGLIVKWQAGAERNLTVRSGLGPWPLPLPADWYTRRADPVVYDDPALFAGWGGSVRAAQQIVEASPFRVVIEGVWRFLPAGRQQETGTAAAAAPGHTWRYVVYPSGQLCLRTTSAAPDGTWPDALVGFALALDGRCGFTRAAPRPSTAGPAPPTFVLCSQPGPERPDLLWCPRQPDAARQQLELVSGDERRVVVIAGHVEPAETVDMAHLLRLWPRDLDAAPEAESFAADYQNPATLSVTRGRLVTDAPGDLDQDGFNEAEGTYELAADSGVLRFKFIPGATLRHEPLFRVRGAPGAACWVYAEGRIITAQGRDREGNVLFALPRPVSRPLTIEVNLR